MRISGRAKSVLLIMSLSLSFGCKTIENAPEVWKCQLNGNPRALYCRSSKTNVCMKNANGQCVKIPVDNDSTVAMQCVFADDYKKLERYTDYLIREAERRCN